MTNSDLSPENMVMVVVEKQQYLDNRIIVQSIFVPLQDWPSVNIKRSFPFAGQEEIAIISESNRSLPPRDFPRWSL